MISTSTPKHHGSPSDFLELQTEVVLEEGGNYSLFMAFKGEMSNGVPGLFLSEYREGVPGDGDNTER